MNWEQGGCGALGEATHNLSMGGVYVRDILTAEEGGEELLTPCLFWLSVFFKTLSWSQLRASS